MDEFSPLLMDLAFLALDHGVKCVVDSGGPLIPFSISDPDRQLSRYVAGTLEESVDRMREQVGLRTDAVRVAICWDGYLTVEGVRSDAVFVEAYETGDDRSIVLAQRYRVEKRRRVTLYGRAAVVDYGRPLFQVTGN